MTYINPEPMTQDNAALVLVDHQVGLMTGVRDYSVAELKHNVVGLAKAAKALGLPTVTTTTSQSGEDLYGGSWSSTTDPIVYTYSAKTWNGKSVWGYDVNGVDGYIGGNFTLHSSGTGEDIFGNTTSTTTTPTTR